MPTPLIALRLDTEHRALLKACVAKKKLTNSDVLRQALQVYAKSLGVRPKKKRAGRKGAKTARVRRAKKRSARTAATGSRGRSRKARASSQARRSTAVRSKAKRRARKG